MRRALEHLSPLSEDDWAPFVGLVVPRSISAGEHLLRAGQLASHVFFVQEGLLREYYTDSEGAEATRHFCQAGEFSGSLADLLRRDTALCSIEALEPGEVWAIEWRECDALAQRLPAWMRLLRRVAENLYLRKVQREHEMLTLPATERYRRFVESCPSLVERLPRKLVASYLGITPVHLSRISPARRARRATGRHGKAKRSRK
jgi:CRP-like cAMP-binding protein